MQVGRTKCYIVLWCKPFGVLLGDCFIKYGMMNVYLRSGRMYLVPNHKETHVQGCCPGHSVVWV